MADTNRRWKDRVSVYRLVFAGDCTAVYYPGANTITEPERKIILLNDEPGKIVGPEGEKKGKMMKHQRVLLI